MTETKRTGGNGLLFLILTMILGYFVYGTVAGALGMGLLYITLLFFIVILSMIPLIGWLISAIISYVFVIPMLLNFTGLYWTWLVSTIFVFHLIVGFMVSVAILFIIVSVVFK